MLNELIKKVQKSIFYESISSWCADREYLVCSCKIIGLVSKSTLPLYLYLIQVYTTTQRNIPKKMRSEEGKVKDQKV